METWLYTNGIDGETQATIPQLAGKTIKGRIYRGGVTYRPSEGPVAKEYKFISEIGRFIFAFPFDGDETLDIPYE